MGVCYIVGAGEGFVPFSVSEGDLVIAADGGCRYWMLKKLHTEISQISDDIIFFESEAEDYE